MDKWRVIIYCPAYNAKSTLEELLERTSAQAKALAKQGICLEKFIIVNDGSTDGTGALLAKLGKKHDFIQVIDKQKNEGATAAVFAGMDAALALSSKGGKAAVRRAILVRMDSDLEHQPEDLTLILHPIIHGNTDACIGYIPVDSRSGLSWQWFNRIFGMAESREFLGLEIPQFCPGFYAMKAITLAKIRPALGKMSEEYITKYGEEMLFLDLAALAVAKKQGKKAEAAHLRPIEDGRIKRQPFGKLLRYFSYHQKGTAFLRARL